jgi:hypothetical protein
VGTSVLLAACLLAGPSTANVCAGLAQLTTTDAQSDPRSRVSLPVVESAGPRASASPRRPPVWSRISIGDPIAAAALRRGLDEAFHLLDQPLCQTLLDEWHDVDRRPLRDRLRSLGMDIQQYLPFVHFAEARLTCRDRMAYTAPGSRVVYVCPGPVERAARENPRYLAAVLIHETLHTLGLGENPPTSSEITERVLRRCVDSGR